MNRLTTFAITPSFFPYIAQVTFVLSPSCLNVNSTVLVPSIGSFQSMRSTMRSFAFHSIIVADPFPTFLPSQLATAPTPDSGPLYVFFASGSILAHGFHSLNFL